MKHSSFAVARSELAKPFKAQNLGRYTGVSVIVSADTVKDFLKWEDNERVKALIPGS